MQCFIHAFQHFFKGLLRGLLDLSGSYVGQVIVDVMRK